ncbi:type VI secretion system Vgr family protein [Caballeronia sp. LjRoot31]|uniref:type VI secretion system Vgr family protein n=1 Tax=Caballeronia sp. LjRoot31 TaxID=3342324 RepID=UPI003ED166C5
MQPTVRNAVANPNHVTTNRYAVEIPGTKLSLSIIEYELVERFNEPFWANIVVTSPNMAISGAESIGRWSIFHIDAEGSFAWSSSARDVERLRTLHGVVSSWEHVSSSADEATYRICIKPRFALLRQTTDSRVFLDASLKDIINASIIDEKVFNHWDIEWQFEGKEPVFEQVLMYEESIEAFISRLCRKYGVYYYFKQSDDQNGARRETIVFGDSAKGYVRALEVPVLGEAGLTNTGQESIHTLRTLRTTVPETISLREHNYRIPEDPLKAEASIAFEDRSVIGTIRRSNEHHGSQADGEAVANLRREEQIARQTTYAGTSNVVGLTPGMVVRLTNRELPDAKYGLVVTSVTSRGARGKAFVNEFEAIPSHLPFRPEYDPQKHWRWMPGPVKALIESRYTDEYAHPDEYGRYPVKYGFDWRETKPGFSSAPLRLLRSSASFTSGSHDPLLPGTEVRVDFTGGDIDRPVIMGAVHDFQRTDIVYGREGWNTRSIWRSPLRRNDVRLEDFKGHEGVKVATVFQNTSVSLGFLVDSEKKERGQGLEATTQGWATVRGAKGVLLSADGLTSPGAPHLEMQAALAQLQSALANVTALVDASTVAGATPADKTAQASLKDALTQLKDAGLIASAPAGIALTTPRAIHHAAGHSVMLTAGKHVDVSAVKRFTLAAGELISMCAHKLGIKLFAAKGKVEIQAQSDGLDLFASKQVHIASVDEDVLIAARSKAVMTSGGAYIKFENGTGEIVCPGGFTIKAASFRFEGPGGFDIPLPNLPKSDFKPTAYYNLTS